MKNNRKRHLSEMSKKLMLQYFLSLIVFILLLAGILGLGYFLGEEKIWRGNEPLYPFLKFVKDYILFIAPVIVLIGWVFITYYFIKKPLNYLDEVAIASKKLANPTDEPIILSSEISYMENELNRAREQAFNNARNAKEAEQRKNDLVVYLAHDLKTPLTSVIGYLTLLKDEKEISPELREKYLGISLEKAQRLEDLINEFFEITRFNLTNITLEYSKVNLNRFLEQLIYEFKPMFMEKNLDCKLEIPADLYIRCDIDKMERVFDNLLRNAVNYSFVNGLITIRVKEDGDNLSIEFINQGNTIPEEKLARIFEQFYRLDSSRSSKSGGAGLGLAIAKEIVELHKGHILANSENELITFQIIMPIK